MGSPQFSQSVQPVGEFKTDSSTTYPQGGSFDDSGGFPIQVDPEATIEELLLSIVDAEVDLEITTSGGDTFTFALDGPATLNRWEIDSVTISDPDNNAPRLEGSWAGDT